MKGVDSLSSAEGTWVDEEVADRSKAENSESPLAGQEARPGNISAEDNPLMDSA